jgi:hypothetical protein
LNNITRDWTEIKAAQKFKVLININEKQFIAKYKKTDMND